MKESRVVYITLTDEERKIFFELKKSLNIKTNSQVLRTAVFELAKNFNITSY